jgi:hypothetical protein
MLAKCTDKEREFIDGYLKNEFSQRMIVDIIRERVTKPQKTRLANAYKAFFQADQELQDARDDICNIANGKFMGSVLSEIESEAIDSK